MANQTSPRENPRKPFATTTLVFLLGLLLTIAPITAHAAAGDFKIGSTPYNTLDAAIAAVQDGQTITMQRDVTLSEGLALNRNITYTLDLGGYTLSEGKTDLTALLYINNGNVTIKNGSVYAPNASYPVYVYNSTLSILSGNYTGYTQAVYCDYATVNITAGHFVRTYVSSTNGCLRSVAGGQINIVAGSAANKSPWKNAASADEVTIIVTPTIAVAYTGLTALKVGESGGGTITYTLSNQKFAASITAADFEVTGLPAGLQQTVTRTSNTVVTVSVSGTPTTANSSTASISIPVIPKENIDVAFSNITPSGTITASAVAKGSGLTATNRTIDIFSGDTETHTFDLDNIILNKTNPGTRSYALSGGLGGNTGVLNGAAVTLGGTNNATLTYKGNGQTLGSATQVITITTDNYTNTTVTITFTAIPVCAVSIATLENGTIELDKTPANYAAGDIVTLTVTPAENYELATISAYKTEDAETLVTLDGIGNTRTFTMPDFGVTVTATFEHMTGTNIDNIVGTKAIVSESYYDLTGKPASATAKGFVIKRTVYDDGSVVITKSYEL